LILWLWWGAGLTATTFLATYLVRSHRHLGFAALATVFSGYVVSANILAPRLVHLDLGLAAPVLTTGSIIWPFTGQISDMINEVYGRRRAYVALFLAYLVNCLFISFIFMGLRARPLWDNPSETFWVAYFQPAPRILAASMITALICETLDIKIFAKLKQLSFARERSGLLAPVLGFSLLRSVASDVANMTLDGALFAILAFSFTIPMETLGSLIVASISVKALLAVIDTPWFLFFRFAIKDVPRDF